MNITTKDALRATRVETRYLRIIAEAGVNQSDDNDPRGWIFVDEMDVE